MSHWPDWEDFTPEEQHAIAVSWLFVALLAFVIGAAIGIGLGDWLL